MDDNKFLFDFFEKNFLVYINEESDTFEIKDKRINQVFTKYQFYDFVKVVFGYNYINIDSIIRDWFNLNRDELIKEINIFFNNCSIILGRTEWEILSEDGTMINKKYIILKYQNRFSKKLISNVFDEWFEDKIIKESERLMGFK